MDYMEVTRAFGVITLVLSLGFLFHLRHYEKMAKKMVGEPSGFILAGVIPLLVGCFTIFYPLGSYGGWSFVLRIIGWIMFLVGVFRILFVHHWISFVNTYIKYIPVLYALAGLIFGLLLCFVGFLRPLYS